MYFCIQKRKQSTRKSFKQTYRQAWEKNPIFKGWLTRVKGKPTKAFCIACKREMTAVVTTLQKHTKTVYHIEQMKLLQIPASSRVDSLLRDQQGSSNAVKEAEIRLAAFVAEHNLSFNIMDHFSDLLPKLCPDSKVASDIKCKRTNVL